MSSTQLATAEDCRSLYEFMNEVYKLAPWTWLEETDIFGVCHPNTDDVAFVSVMGNGGEHFAISAYLGTTGLYGFLDMQRAGPNLQPEDLLNTPQLQASFEDREALEKRDRQQIKTLGMKYRGRNAWPLFRSYRPGVAPWFLETHEAQFLSIILQQLLEFAPKLQDNRRLVQPRGRKNFLVRVPTTDTSDIIWNNEIRSFDRPPTTVISPNLDASLIAEVRGLPQVPFVVEADAFLLPRMMTGGSDERPFFPYVLLMLDTTQDIMLASDMFEPRPTIEAMWTQILTKLLTNFIKLDGCPSTLRIRNPILLQMLKPLKRELGLPLRRVRYMPMLDYARTEMEQYLHHNL